MIRALLVDDEAPARSELRYLLASHPQVEVVGEAASAAEALKLAAAVAYDVVFIDVEMPGLSGMDAARLVHGRAGRAATRVRDRTRAIRDRGLRGRGARLPAQAGRPRTARPGGATAGPPGRIRRPVEKIPVVSGGETILLDWDDLHFARADGDYCRVHTYDRSYLCTKSLRALGGDAPRDRFARIHRSSW